MRHYWWRQVLGLGGGDLGVDEHLFLSTLLEHGLCYDQYNLGESLTFEAISRRYQLWEEVYAASLAEADHGGTGGGDTWLDERRLFLGHGLSRSSALVAPQLSRHVASRLSEESAVLKERRKGREEKELARAAKPAAEQGDSALRARGRGRGRK